MVALIFAFMCLVAVVFSYKALALQNGRFILMQVLLFLAQLALFYIGGKAMGKYGFMFMFLVQVLILMIYWLTVSLVALVVGLRKESPARMANAAVLSLVVWFVAAIYASQMFYSLRPR